MKFGKILIENIMINRKELSKKIMNGVIAAHEKLIISKAKDDDYLVVSKDGKIVKIPARELLKKKDKE
jgi:hypothetical protein